MRCPRVLFDRFFFRAVALATVVLSLSMLACLGSAEGEGEGGEGEGEGECGVVPVAWDSPDWEANAVAALALRAQLDTLTGTTTMRGAEQGTAVIGGIVDLTALLDAGDLSLNDVATAAGLTVANDALGEFLEVVAAGERVGLVDVTGEFAAGAAGGIYGSNDRGINEGGIEVRQIVDKALFAGGFYNFALGLTAGPIDVATVDAISAAWGSNNTLDPALAPQDSANYANGMGYHADAVASLVAARAYAADVACTAERDAALVTFFRTWEKSMFARFSHYATLTASLAAGGNTDDAYADAIHQISEGVGLVLGFRGVANPAAGPLRASARVINDAQIEALMAAVGVDIADLGASTTGELVTETNFATVVLTLEGLLGEALSAPAAEVEGWREPTPG